MLKGSASKLGRLCRREEIYCLKIFDEIVRRALTSVPSM